MVDSTYDCDWEEMKFPWYDAVLMGLWECVGIVETFRNHHFLPVFIYFNQYTNISPSFFQSSCSASLHHHTSHYNQPNAGPCMSLFFLTTNFISFLSPFFCPLSPHATILNTFHQIHPTLVHVFHLSAQQKSLVYAILRKGF